MSEPVADTLTDPERLATAREIVSRFSKYAAAGGLIPVPVVDMAAVAAVQLKMLEQLSHLYGVSFRENVGKEIIGTIVGVGTSYNFGSSALMAFNQYIRFVPVAGQLFGLAIIPAFAGAATALLGRVFVRHFESGGELLNLDIKAARASFRSDFARTSREVSPPVGEAATVAP